MQQKIWIGNLPYQTPLGEALQAYHVTTLFESLKDKIKVQEIDLARDERGRVCGHCILSVETEQQLNEILKNTWELFGRALRIRPFFSNFSRDKDQKPEARYKLQELFCQKNGLPMFAPLNCYSCGSPVFEKVSAGKAESELITGCPNCNYSFVG